MSQLRVIHLPGHTPYARKLRCSSFAPVNGWQGVPLGASVPWLLSQPTWNFFDVAHLHSVELVSRADLAQLIERLDRRGKGFVVTLHDLLPTIEPEQEEFGRKTSLALAATARPVTLTPWARAQIVERFGVPAERVQVVPHGYVAPPREVPNNRDSDAGRDRLVLAAYGALRPNRSFIAVADLWSRLTSAGHPGLLRLLVRSISADDVDRYATTVAKIMELLRSGAATDVRLISGAATDREIVDLCRRSSVVVLPYRWGTHSGQLELACDLGTPAVTPRFDGFVAQCRLHDGGTPPILWVEPGWLRDPDGVAPLASAVARFLEKQAAAGHTRPLDPSWRLDEHESILSNYADLYEMNGPR